MSHVPSSTTSRRWVQSRALAALALAALCACGDDLPASEMDRFYARCAAPRSGTDPATNRPFDDVPGTLADEKQFLRAWIDELYLWYREVPAHAPHEFATPLEYFNALKTPARTASGRAKDQFHFTYPTDVWVSLSRSGVQGGYGVQWSVLAARPPRRIVAAYVEGPSPAETAQLRRGAEVLIVDGVDVIDGSDVDTLNGGLFPEELGATHTFVIRDPGGLTRTITMVSENLSSRPVQNVKTLDTPTGKVGYLTFNDHIATAEAQLVAAVRQLQDEQISDLVLDLRYNGGGYLSIASQLAYMLAGPAASSGKAFETLTFNDKHRDVDPITGQTLTPRPFLSRSAGFSVPAGQELPTLNLARVFVLTGSGTCSASEAIINGLRGIDLNVIQIGATTCGKPYGFYPQDNCGTTYFAIQFQGVNNKGYGDYADGFVPGGTGEEGVPGCMVLDDFTKDLGDPSEARLAAALAFRDSGACPAPRSTLDAGGLSAVEGYTPKPRWLQNRIAGTPARR